MALGPDRGFIVHPSYRLERGRPVVQLYGRLESGGTFLVRDGRAVPYFYVRERDAERARELGGGPVTPAGRVTLRGEPVALVQTQLPRDTVTLSTRLVAEGRPTFEADVRHAMRFLIDRGLRGAIAIDGPARAGTRVGVVFDEPQLAPATFRPVLSVLSLDIETDPAAQRVLSIAFYGCGAAEVLLWTPPGASCPAGAVPCPDERSLLQTFCRRVRELDPDVLTGWNVIDFDLAVLVRRAERLGLALDIGREAGTPRVNSARVRQGPSLCSVPGRMVLDGVQLLRGSFVTMEEQSLDFVAREVLGEGKVLGGAGRLEEIQRTFREDRELFVRYNLTDARLALAILDRLALVELAVERSLLTGMPLDRVASSIAAFDFLYLSQLGRRRVVAPTRAAPAAIVEPTAGGHVLEPDPGVYRNVATLDFKSLYPSLIRTFQIDPWGHLPEPRAADDPIVAPNGAAFRREPGILPALLDELVPLREAAQRAGEKTRSQAIKILMNSFYGVLGTPACRFYDPALANAITGFGQLVLLWSKAWIEQHGARVLYGDTDSLFVLTGETEPDVAGRTAERLTAQLNRELADHVRDTWRVASRLELVFDTLYLRLLLPRRRHATAGARKRYVGLVATGELVFTGMEVVRRDWTELAKCVQREIYARLFADQRVEAYLRQVVADLRAGRLDDLLVYRKGLRKELGRYVASTPPHVAAARKMTTEPGSLIAYVMTLQGPEPAAERRSPLDREHYVQKQVRPVAEPVLDLLGLAFDRVVGDDTQLRLF